MVPRAQTVQRVTTLLRANLDRATLTTRRAVGKARRWRLASLPLSAQDAVTPTDRIVRVKRGREAPSKSCSDCAPANVSTCRRLRCAQGSARDKLPRQASQRRYSTRTQARLYEPRTRSRLPIGLCERSAVAKLPVSPAATARPRTSRRATNPLRAKAPPAANSPTTRRNVGTAPERKLALKEPGCRLASHTKPKK